MSERFIFRQVYYKDLQLFLDDGEIRAKNHSDSQICHQASYESIVNRRGSNEFSMPCGGVVNDYVPFYFSPLTSYSYAIKMGRVVLKSPSGVELGATKDEDRIFFVCSTKRFHNSQLEYYFSDFALNSQVPAPTIEKDLGKLGKHIDWTVFDDIPMKAAIGEIGYSGVCKYFNNSEEPPGRQLRSQKRMAEFLVQDALPLDFVRCIVAKSEYMRDNLQTVMDASSWDIPILSNRGCYF